MPTRVQLFYALERRDIKSFLTRILSFNDFYFNFHRARAFQWLTTDG